MRSSVTSSGFWVEMLLPFLPPARRYASARVVAGEQGVGIGVLALPPPARVGEAADGEVEVVVAHARVPGVTDVRDHLAALDGEPLAHPGGVALQVGVVVEGA